ncbi:MAG: hypothetical protein NT061_12725 [Spirochaetes bacterium]|nr:hypothetical protein [Spirochaetota bacterium]
MKKYLCVFLLVLAAASNLPAQTTASSNKAAATTDPGKPRILLAYELADKNLDPWRAFFRTELDSAGYALEEVEAARLSATTLSNYDLIVIYGAVMAFTFKEPMRDWLNTKPKLAGGKVALFVTANRWFLRKYNDQLLGLLRQADAIIVDAVSTATKALSDDEKRRLVRAFVEKLPR